MNELKYVLVTAARDEARFIEKALHSVVMQTIPPVKWVVVSDGSTDETDAIARRYETRFAFIKFIRVDNQKDRDFASKVFALRAGFTELAGCPYGFIGILDADITLKPEYYEQIINEFRKDPKLGIAGGLLYDCQDSTMRKRYSSPWSVPGGIQLFRRECFEKIGGIMPLRYGEEDTVAEIKARMAGYTVRAFYDVVSLHHRLTGTATMNFPSTAFHNGFRDYYAGTYLPFEIVKCIRRLPQRPYLLIGIFRFCGYVWATLRRFNRQIPNDVVKYLRMEQKKRIIAFLKNPFPRAEDFYL
jgi:glycosyltransferase involved in cell wall biosynthesis